MTLSSWLFAVLALLAGVQLFTTRDPMNKISAEVRVYGLIGMCYLSMILNAVKG